MAMFHLLVCVLCQQTLINAALDVLRSFYQMINVMFFVITHFAIMMNLTVHLLEAVDTGNT
jgi:hypothetical protein